MTDKQIKKQQQTNSDHHSAENTASTSQNPLDLLQDDFDRLIAKEKTIDSKQHQPTNDLTAALSIQMKQTNEVTQDFYEHLDSQLPAFKTQDIQAQKKPTEPIKQHSHPSCSQANQKTVIADLSSINNETTRPKKYFLTVALTMMAATGSLYWYNMATPDQPQELEQTAQKIQTEHIQLSKPTTTSSSLQASQSSAVKTHSSTQKTPANMNKKPNPRNASTAILWNISAPVKSNKMAIQYMARLQSQQLNSETIESSIAGEKHYLIRIKGFLSQADALNTMTRLAKLQGLENARVYSNSSQAKAYH